jgi:hypothetical protein
MYESIVLVSVISTLQQSEVLLMESECFPGVDSTSEWQLVHTGVSISIPIAQIYSTAAYPTWKKENSNKKVNTQNRYVVEFLIVVNINNNRANYKFPGKANILTSSNR